MRSVLTLFVLFLFVEGNIVSAQNAFRPVVDLDKFRQEFRKESSKINTIMSDFRQEKQLIALTETIHSQGKFWFRREDKVRINYEKPFVYQMVINGDRISIRDDEKVNQMNVKSSKLFQQVNRIMLDCIRGSVLDSRDFTATVFENATQYKIVLNPQGKALRDFFQTINLFIDKKTYSVASIEMNEAGGDKTVMIFTNKVLNTPVDNAIFSM